jgi:hypothetical protein
MLNSQFSSEGPAIAVRGAMLEKIARSDQLEDRLIDFAARIIQLAGRLPRTFQARHIANQNLTFWHCRSAKLRRSPTGGKPRGLYSQNAHRWKGAQ